MYINLQHIVTSAWINLLETVVATHQKRAKLEKRDSVVIFRWVTRIASPRGQPGGREDPIENQKETRVHHGQQDIQRKTITTVENLSRAFFSKAGPGYMGLLRIRQIHSALLQLWRRVQKYQANFVSPNVQVSIIFTLIPTQDLVESKQLQRDMTLAVRQLTSPLPQFYS